jgi:hypothetical protein
MQRRPGPASWINWRAFEAGSSSLGAIEAGCYTDAHVTDEVRRGLGPIQVLNTVPAYEELGRPNMSIVLRIEAHDPGPDLGRIDWSKTAVGPYTGASVEQELAALLSLALGIRCRSGGVTRDFEAGKADPRGTPREFGNVRPYLPPPRHPGAPVLPDIARTINLTEACELLVRFPAAGPKKAVALVRAARLYEQAVWIAEIDPELSWLLLVSAIESAAAHAFPQDGPRRRFVRFVDTFRPRPPSPRHPFDRLDWSQMAGHAEQIYRWRSAALHEGIPFPYAMCIPPRRDTPTGPPPETPGGLGHASGATVWKAADIPLLLWTFTYIAQGALCRWWRRTRRPGTPAGAARIEQRKRQTARA